MFGHLYLAGLAPGIADSGNAGILDLKLALEWVRDNIAITERREDNIAEKLKDGNFARDMGPLLASDYTWDLVSMSEKVSGPLISRLSD